MRPVRRRPRAPFRPPSRRSPALTFGLLAGLVVVGGALLGHAAGLAPPVTALVGVNLATLALYAYDKAVAGGVRLRVPEIVLHALGFAGGTVAAFVAQRLLRHKTQKASFQRVFAAIALVQLTALALWWAGARFS